MSGAEFTQIAFAGLLLIAAVWDFRFLRIPHKLNLAIAALFVVHAAVGNLPAGVILEHIAAAAVIFVFFLIIAHIGPEGSFGGGDLYFVTVLALFIGRPFDVMEWLILSNVCVALYVAALLLLRALGGVSLLLALVPFSQSVALPGWISRVLDPEYSLRGSRIAYGPPYALGALLWMWF